MTIEEAIKELENGKWWDALPGISHDRKTILRFHTALDVAITALRVQREPNAPLTLDELREMDGEPVWVIPPADADWEPCWMIVMVEFGIVAKDMSISHAIYCSFSGCGTDWQAYRRKPEEGNHVPSAPTIPSWAEHLQSRFLRTE